MSTFGIDVLRFFVGTIFLLSSAAKWRQRDKLIKLVDDYAILPPRSVAPVAQLLPVAELALAAGLLTNVIPVVPASIACVFALAFAIAAFITLRRGRSIDCGCFGVSSTEKVTWETVIRGLCLAAMAAVVASAQGGVLVRVPPLRLPQGGGLAAFIMASTASLLYLVLSENPPDDEKRVS